MLSHMSFSLSPESTLKVFCSQSRVFAGSLNAILDDDNDDKEDNQEIGEVRSLIEI